VKVGVSALVAHLEAQTVGWRAAASLGRPRVIGFIPWRAFATRSGEGPRNGFEPRSIGYSAWIVARLPSDWR